MNRSTKLQPIAKINKQQERNAGRLHGETMRQAEQQQKQLDELINYRDHYSKAFQAASEAGLSVVQMQEYKLFINRLDDAISQQRQQVNNGQSRCETSQKEWMQKRSECQKIDKVIENRQQVEHQEMKKREQRELENLPHKTFSNL
jgi:flagellar FliJ protein